MVWVLLFQKKIPFFLNLGFSDVYAMLILKTEIHQFLIAIVPSNWVPSRLVVCKTWFCLSYSHGQSGDAINFKHNENRVRSANIPAH